MAKKVSQLDVRGLSTATNSLKDSGTGALVEAQNVVTIEPDVIRSRVGFKDGSYATDSGVGFPMWIQDAAEFNGLTFTYSRMDPTANYAASGTNDPFFGQVFGYGAGVQRAAANAVRILASDGTFDINLGPTGRLQNVGPAIMGLSEDRRQVWLDQSAFNGAVAIPTGIWKPAAPRTGNFGVSNPLFGASTTFPIQFAYRATLRWQLDDGRFMESIPSDRVTLTYTSAAVNTSPGLWLPISYNGFPLLTDKLFVRFYRTLLSSSVNGVTNSEDYYLAAEIPTKVVAGSLTYTAWTAILGNPPLGPWALVNGSAGGDGHVVYFIDQVPDVFLADPLYTNATDGLGQGAAAYPPPNSRVSTNYGRRFWQGHLFDLPYIEVQLLGAGGAKGLQVGDVIEIAGMKLGASTNVGVDATFVLDTSGTPSNNIRNTAQNICNAFNLRASQRVTATDKFWPQATLTYASTLGDLPGKIRIETPPGRPQTLSFANVYILSNSPSGGTAWSPSIANPITVGTVGTEKPGTASYSDLDQPWVVRRASRVTIGRADADLQSLVGTRDSLFAVKEDGLFRQSGVDPTAPWQPFDPTMRCVAPQTAIAFDNDLVLWTERGVIRVTEGGPQSISIGIDDILADLISTPERRATVKALAFAIALERENHMILAAPSGPGATTCDLLFIWNTKTTNWSIWKIRGKTGTTGFTGGDTDQDGAVRLFTRGQVVLERLTGDWAAFEDPTYVDAAASTDAGKTSFVSMPLAKLAVPGDVVIQNDDVNGTYFRVLSVDTTTGRITVDSTMPSAATSSYTLRTAVFARIKWSPITGGDGAAFSLKHYLDSYLALQTGNQDLLRVGWSTDESSREVQVTVPNTDCAPVSWGGGKAWGTDSWGRNSMQVMVQVQAPTISAEAAQLNVSVESSELHKPIQVLGLGTSADEAGDRVATGA